MKKRILFLSSFLFLFIIFHQTAFANEPTVLRVAFPSLEGYSMTREDGSRHGLVVDYLNEISKYTGWRYEYIDVTSEELMPRFLAGDFDLMGSTYYIEELADSIGYPEYNAGFAKSMLFARNDDFSISGYNYNDFNNKTIGVYERADESIRRLEQFLALNNLNCTLHFYSYEEMTEDGNLFQYLENGEVDLLLGNSADVNGTCRAVAYFDSQPHYIVTQADAHDLLEQLNNAMRQILSANTNFAEQCYAKNFPSTEIHNYILTDEERAYVDQKGTVTVALPTSHHPFYCNSEEDCHNGIVPDILASISDFSGLQFSYVYADSYAEALALVSDGKADIAGFYMGETEDALNHGFSLTSSYASLNNLLVRHKSVTYPSPGLTCAMLAGRTLPSDIQAAVVVYYDTPEEVLQAVASGAADFAYGLSSQLEKMLLHRFYFDLVPVTIPDQQHDISFALKFPSDGNLLTILNKAINRIPLSEKAGILQTNLVSVGKARLSLADIVYANPFVTIFVITVFLLLLLIITLIAARSRIKEANIRSEIEKAKASSQAKNEFFSRMSHEIRTPMNAILGIIDLLNLQPEEDQKLLKSNLRKLRSSAQYLLNLLNDILDMSRLNSGKMTIAQEPFSLLPLLEEITEMMQPVAKSKMLSLVTEFDIIHSGLSGDALHLKQVLINLLSNAIKFTPDEGVVCFVVSEGISSPSGASYTFRVIDNGVGIKPEDQKRIFDAFEQTGTNFSKSQGTGLGLAISSNIVRLMQGEILLKSEYGKGSEFFFTLTFPFCDTPVAEDEEDPETPLRGLRFLLAEDNEINAEVLTSLLELQGAHITLATDGVQAVELFQQNAPASFDAIFMDMQMPFLNGAEATRQIRSLLRVDAQSIPIIAMTANSSDEDRAIAKEAGMNDFVTKPLDLKLLYACLKRCGILPNQKQ